MTTITSRLYRDEKDFQIIINLLNEIRPAIWLKEFPTKIDIEENLALVETRANTKLWFDGNQPIGWAYVDDSHNLHWELKRQYTDIVGGEIVTWGETCIRKALGAEDTSTLDVNCREDNKERLAFIEGYGFHRTNFVTIRMKRSLSEPIPSPELPDGFFIRSVIGLEEAGAIASTHRAAFGTEYMTTENRLILMNTSEYDPSLDLVVVALDGTIAAYCTCSVNADSIGSTDPVATHPRFQLLGLAKAILLKGLQMLKDRGMKFARLSTSKDNIAMQKTAESVGFFLEHQVLWFEKEIKKQFNT